jgi:alkylation response protein AidB-like acyl-CoA dehydrogenase
MSPDTSQLPAAMRFALTEDQRQLYDSASRFVRACYSYEEWRRLAGSGSGFSSENWSQMAEMGWMALALPEEHGGIGMGARERLALMEVLGRGIVLEPYWSTAVLCAEIVRRVGTLAQQADLLPRIASGELRLALADTEPGTRWSMDRLSCGVEKDEGRDRISGKKIAVLDAPSADIFLVLAPGRKGGVSVFLVEANAAGLLSRNFPTVDSRRCADLTFDGVFALACLGDEGAAAEGVEIAKDHAIVALCGEALGAMSMLIESTIEYLKTRRQFGQPLSEFQVLRHRIVDMFIASEQARSLAIVAAESLDASPVARRLAVSAAKWQCGIAGRLVGENALQLHGGIGMTDELPIGHYFKRLMAIDVLLGNTDFHLQRFMANTEQEK